MRPHGILPFSRGKSRVGKKQVAAFLRPEQAAIALQLAREANCSVQGLLGRAIDAAFDLHGHPAMASAESRRPRSRLKLKSAIRTPEMAPKCRVGRRVFAGWFPSTEVDRFVKLSVTLDLTLNDLVEAGLAALVTEKFNGLEGENKTASAAESTALE